MMKNISLWGILLSLVITGRGAAGNAYIWPMKLNPELTSKFCDYRAGHFHSGLDIRTQGRIGFPVYAVDDGYVFRASTSFRGYGKALYLKLKDNRIVVYGHLSGFFRGLEGIISKAQFKDMKYNQDLYFTSQEFPVKKGRQVAYSGSSGTGAPHLHFELRSPLNNPVNPLESGFSINDKSAPVFNNLALRYYEAQTPEDPNPVNPCKLEFVPVSRLSKSNEYIISDTIICEGQLALAVSGGDYITGAGFLYGFYGLRLGMEDSILFMMKSDSLSFNTTRQLNYVRDLELIRAFGDKGKADNDANIFYRLYAPHGSIQYFWGNFETNSGILKPSSIAGKVDQITIDAFDEAGNSSTLRFYKKMPDFSSSTVTILQCYKQKDTISVAVVTDLNIANIVSEFRNSLSSGFKSTRCRVAKVKSTRPQKSELYWIRLITRDSDGEYRFRCLDMEGKTTGWIYIRDDKMAERFRIYGSPDCVRVEYSHPLAADSVRLLIKSGDNTINYKMEPFGPRLYMADLIGLELSGPVSFTFKINQEIALDTGLTLYPVYPEKTTDAVSSDSTLVASFLLASAFYPAYVFISNGVHTNLDVGNGIVYDLQPDFFIANAPIKYRVDAARLGLVGKNEGLYGYSDASGGWSFIGKISGSNIEANGLGLGKLAVIEDDQPPEITSLSPAGNIKSRAPELVCIISDKISGLALDDGLAMSIDKIWVPAEYDIDTGRFSYKLKNPLKAGHHELKIIARDNQGNVAVKITTFNVSGK